MKLQNALKAKQVDPMDDAMLRASGLVAGSASAVGLTGMTIVADTQRHGRRQPCRRRELSR